MSVLSEVQGALCKLKVLKTCYSYAEGTRGAEPGAGRREKAKPPVEERNLAH